MTVAAIVLARDDADALGDAAGRPAARRIVEAAWAGGALPIVVVAPGPEGPLEAALAGTPALAVRTEPGATDASSLALGASAARDHVAETDAVLAWPARMAWVDPETVTSLIEAHGVWPGDVLRPAWAGASGWPALVPLARLPGLLDGAGGDLDARFADLRGDLAARALELGDPGAVRDRSVPVDALPAYEGPPEPVSGPPPEWGAAAGERADAEDPVRSPRAP
jgi:CTP:molybdopterin cytidylyltransferase MocA